VNEFIEQFLLESRELVEQATHDLLALENAPDDRERLESAFRAFHTLKGGAGIVGFAAMGQAMHVVEDLLTEARAGTLRLTAQVIGDCLACIDQVVQWMDAIEARDGELPAGAQSAADAVIQRFKASQDRRSELPAPHVLADADAVAAAQDGMDEPIGSVPAGRGPAIPTRARELLEAQVALLAQAGANGLAGRQASAGAVAVNVLMSAGMKNESGEIERAAASSLETNAPEVLRNALESLLSAAAAEAAASSPAPGQAGQAGTARTLRIDAARIDALVNLTGELTVAKNAIGHAAKLAQEGADNLGQVLKDRYAVLDRLVGELQRAVLSVRVLPMRQVFQRFPRLLREISAELGKPVALEVDGEDTEADKAIVEMLFEPLLHVLRNAIDHGVEPAAERAALGKAAVATISLRAFREGQHVIVEIGDDGHGIDMARVRQVARERGLMSGEVLAAMSEPEIMQLIFAPGFSTAARVTGLSGRGVGMDAVRTGVERLGGQVTLDSRPGKGTTVRFTLPFSIMMTPVMTVEAGGQLFGIPLDAVVETLRISSASITSVGAAQAIVWRDRTIPLVQLAAVLGVTLEERTSARSESAEARESETTVVVTRIAGQVGALQVDRPGERMEVMLKPLDGLLSGIPALAGSTLLGDGSVLLVLDPAELLN
jgi:two-component system chemotaxis sensor kinase CheA